MPDIHPFWGDERINKKSIRGTIKNWSRHYYDSAHFVIVGDLYTPDGNSRIGGYYYFRTSTVLSVSEDNSGCETLNSLYRLENEIAPRSQTA